MKKALNLAAPVLVALLALVFIGGCYAKASMEVRSSASASGKAGGTTATESEPTGVEPTPPTPKGTAPKPVEPTPPTIPQPPFDYTLVDGGNLSQVPCPNTSEVLNGIDDDCDGLVDEDWVKSGPLQITLWWEGGPDLDLAVKDPKGQTVNVKKRKSSTGGEMDKDSRSACKGGETIENVYWVKDPPKGTYTVNVKYYSTCGESKTNPPPIEANVGISYNGQFFGPFKKTLTFKEDAALIQFVLE
jgi:hypothetical protein